MVDLARFEEFVAARFGADRNDRLVGIDREHDSGYNCIHRFFGKDKVDPGSVQIRHLKRRFEFTDDRIASFANFREQELRQQGRLKDGPDVAKVVEANFDSDPSVITIQPATYGQFAGSCFFLDRPDPMFGDFGSLRSYYYAARDSTSTSVHPLAVCLGVAGLILIEENGKPFMLRICRSSRVATMAGTFGASVAGVVDYDSKYKTLLEMMQVSLTQEITEEINLTEDQYRLIPLAYSQELYRGEHPQLFCLVQCQLSKAQLTEQLLEIPEADREFDRFDFLPMSQGRLDNREAISEFNFEGKMSYYLAEEFMQD